MILFDRICFVIAFALGVVLLLSGAVGVVLGVSLSFTLPPVLGVLPAFAG